MPETYMFSKTSVTVNIGDGYSFNVPEKSVYEQLAAIEFTIPRLRRDVIPPSLTPRSCRRTRKR